MQLIICEKPEQAKAVAAALEPIGGFHQETHGKTIYHTNGDYVVVSASGHLYSFELSRSRDFPNFDYGIVVNPKNRNAEERIECIKKFLSEASIIIGATDNDVEGERVFFEIIDNNGPLEAPIRRMRYRSLAPDAIMDAFENQVDVNDAWASMARVRQIADLLWGKNVPKGLSRSYTAFAGKGRYMQCPAGRVQTPVLAHTVKHELEITNFEPERIEHDPRWQVFVVLPDGKYNALVEIFEDAGIPSSEDLKLKLSADAIFDEKYRVKCRVDPDPVFNIDGLRKGAKEEIGIDFEEIDRILQFLYLNRYISYPRTESQRIPEDEGYNRQILTALGHDNLAENKPAEGPDHGDLAHDGLHPTSIVPPSDLPATYLQIYRMIRDRYLDAFKGPHRCWDYRLHWTINNWGEIGIDEDKRQGEFTFGRRTIETGCMEDEVDVDGEIVARYTALEGTRLPVTYRIRPAYIEVTKPPERLKPDDLFNWMRDNNIGTDATRVNIMGELWRNRYVKGKAVVVPTPIGIRLIQTLSKVCERMTEVEMTREMEGMLKGIDDGGDIGDLVDMIKEEISETAARFDKDLPELGRILAGAGECEKCGSNLIIIRARGDPFIGCSGFPDCNFQSPL